ncbi:hypothetical protein P168DRAFT_289569 [Aspergillus campestris IBT 28561]|uniref:Integral membrane protein n=1 Tax=Aspergillus campestris (strain IBT 28561) TaxID=1392248 RepID=A0A2I1D4A6_ASPC2|nr:uncharacterized protein P168DRAFT_289569 [Aspergillus campestris IBT 28561]PKY04696.1 hypothetical protein P168DRAFT_289569 [Aspergillus campestris IBT 28561]
MALGPFSPSLYRFFLLFSVILSVLAADDTQLIPATGSKIFPQCATTCNNLKQAQTLCVPPTAPATGKTGYVSCFCQSNLLLGLKNSADGICDDTCSSPADKNTLKKWYSDYCSSGGNIPENSGDKNDDSKGDNKKDNDNDNKDNNNDDKGSNKADSNDGSHKKVEDPPSQSWIAGHYQWVIMVVVLIVGFAALAVFGVWLKRRHDAKYPGLYHAAATGASDSGILRPGQGPGPVPSPPVAWMAGQDPSTSGASSSSRTDVVPTAAGAPKSGSSGRLQKSTPSQPTDDIEIREVPR